jgi:hypothetical protein
MGGTAQNNLSKMKKLLERISWLTHKWNYKFQLLDIYLHDNHESWGFSLVTFYKNFVSHSLLAISFRLPNKTHVQRFTIDDWDILYLRSLLWKTYDDLSDSKLWSPYGLSTWDEFRLSILSKLFK